MADVRGLRPLPLQFSGRCGAGEEAAAAAGRARRPLDGLSALCRGCSTAAAAEVPVASGGAIAVVSCTGCFGGGSCFLRSATAAEAATGAAGVAASACVGLARHCLASAHCPWSSRSSLPPPSSALSDAESPTENSGGAALCRPRPSHSKREHCCCYCTCAYGCARSLCLVRSTRPRPF